MGLSLSERVKRMNAARQAQQEAPAAQMNNPVAAAPMPPPPAPRPSAATQASAQAADTTSPAAPAQRRRREELIAEVLAKQKSPTAAASEPASPPAAANLTSGYNQDQLVAGMKARMYQRSLDAARRAASNAASAAAPSAIVAAGGKLQRSSPPNKRRKPASSPAASPMLLDAELDGVDADEDEDALVDSEEEEHRRRRKQPQQRQPKKPSQSKKLAAPGDKSNTMSVVAAFDNVFATQVQIEEEEDMAEEPQQCPLVQPAQAPAPQPQAPVDSNAPLLPPPPTEYRLRLDENGEEIPLGSADEPYLDLAVPASIAKYLRPYQRTGIKFLLGNYARGRGCLLADDMGLGKTLQTVAFLSAILGKSGDPRVDSTHPQLPKFERLQHAATTTARDGSAVIDLNNDFYAPIYSIGAPALIVCPPSLIDNWSEEFNKWGTFRVIKLRSNTLDTGIAALLRGHSEVGITSYDAIRNNADKFAKVPWHVSFYDEAHKLKNPRAAQTRACARLPTRLRYALSGTPMQNDYEELYHLINFIVPGALGLSHTEFQQEYSKKIKHGMRSDATEEQIAEGTTAQEALKEILQPVMLRRTKEIIAHQMPKKKDNIVFCQLAPLQKRAYLRALQLPDVQLLLLKAHEDCPCGSGVNVRQCEEEHCPGYYKLTYDQGGVLYPHFHFCECGDVFDAVSNPDGCKHHKPDGCWRVINNARYNHCPFCILMPLLTILRKISLHLDLVKANPNDEEMNPIKFKWDQEVSGAVFGTDSEALGGYVQSNKHVEMTADIIQSSGKLAALKGLLTKWAADSRGSGGLPHKVLIFSTSVRMLKIVSKMADNAGWAYKYLTGETPQKERQALVNAFNAKGSNDYLFIVSTGAGGVGLNLTAANKVVILDPSYSPAADLQAMDRAFRIGQKRNVDVYRLVAAGTIEERIYMRQISKQQHNNVAVDGADCQKRLFTGVKGDISHKGDLWGFENMLGTLLADEVNERVPEAMEKVVGAAETAEDSNGAGPSRHSDGDGATTGSYTIEEVPEEVTAEMEAASAARNRNGGVGGSISGAVEDGHDPGLEAALLEDRAQEEEEEEEEEEEAQAQQQQAQAGEEEEEDVFHFLQEAGLVKGIVDHSIAMAPSKKEGQLRKDAVANQNAAKLAAEHQQNVALAASDVTEPASAVECLAAWKHVSVRDMAKMLLEMTEKERTELRYAYCKDAPKEGLFPSPPLC